jgi:hypothetical protein
MQQRPKARLSNPTSAHFREPVCKQIWLLMTTGYWKILRTKCSSCGGAVRETASGCYFFGGGHGACRHWQRIGARILLLHIAKLQRRGAGSAARRAGAVCECLLRARGARSPRTHTENEKFDKLTSRVCACVRAQWAASSIPDIPLEIIIGHKKLEWKVWTQRCDDDALALSSVACDAACYFFNAHATPLSVVV